MFGKYFLNEHNEHNNTSRKAVSSIFLSIIASSYQEKRILKTSICHCDCYSLLVFKHYSLVHLVVILAPPQKKKYYTTKCLKIGDICITQQIINFHMTTELCMRKTLKLQVRAMDFHVTKV